MGWTRRTCVKHTKERLWRREDGESTHNANFGATSVAMAEVQCHRFLLRYTSRDSVQLLDQGKGGVHEARTAIAKYEEASPLYGLLIYRRRKVLIKFIPEGTSRLLQGMLASRMR